MKIRTGNITLASKLRALFWISVSNFVIPVFFALPQAILAVITPQQYVKIAYVNIVRVYVSIIAVVFATLWASGNTWYSENIPDGTNLLSTFRAPLAVRRPCRAELGDFPISDKSREAGEISIPVQLTMRLDEEASIEDVGLHLSDKEGRPKGTKSANF